MSSARLSRSAVLALLICGVAAFPLQAATPKKHAHTPAPPAGVPSDGTVTGVLTVNGTKFPLTHIYGRKREAWPADAKALGAKELDELSCGIVELIFTNAALPEATIASILQNTYRGSEKIRGLRFVIDGTGKYKWASMFLLESGAEQGWGMTQSSGSISAGRRYTGKVELRNEQVTQVRMYNVSFDTPVRVQYARTETETAERIPDGRFAEEFLKTLPGEWKIERWLGLGCTTAGGTLTVGERISPQAFRGTLHLTTSKGDEIDEEVTISTGGTKVHVEGGKVSVPDTVWVRDVLDLDLWQNLMVGNNTTDFVVLRKM
jgi:hypothetical protein